MKFTCEQQQLSKALNTVSKAITTRTTIPILKGILIKVTDEGKMILSASDLDLSIEKTINADVEEAGALVVPARLFSDIIKKLPSGILSFEMDEREKLIIKTLTTKYDIVTQSADDFPKTAEAENIIAKLSFDKEIFKDMIRKTQFCASIDETKGVISGVLVEMDEDITNMVALDGFRMAVARERMKNEAPRKIIINGKIMNEIGKILQEADDDEDIELVICEKRAIVLLDKTKVVLRLLSGEFIAYKDILPKQNSTFVKINRAVLTEAIERASLLTRDIKNRTIRIKIQENLMNITSASEEGNVKEDIIMEKTGGDLEIGFNYRYLLDALKVIDDEEIMMEFDSAVKPCLIKPVTGDSYEYLVLPVRIPMN